MRTPTTSSSVGSGPFSRSYWREASPTRIAIVVLVAVTLYRLWFATRVELVADEAYYWLWSKNLAASYRDKGPLVAWTIALGTRLFGDTVFGIRVFAVLLCSGIGWQLFVLARRLFDEQTAFWSLVVALVLPMFAVGSILMTIDPLSVFSWAWAANLFWTALQTRKTRHWLALGFVIGLGFLAKFTNGVQLGCVALFLLWSREHRSLFFSRQTVAMCLAFLVAITPVLYWNMTTGWVHVMALHSRSGVEDSFHIRPLELLEFLGGQVGTISPLLALGLAVATVALLWKRHNEVRIRFLMSQFLPIYGLFAFFSLNVAGKPNWPIPGLITGIIVLVVYWREVIRGAPHWRWAASAALGLAFLMSAVMHNTDPLRLPPHLEPLRRAQGWADFAAHVQRARNEHQANLLIGNHYSPASMMAFYLPDHPVTFVPKQEYGKSQFSLWPGYQVTTNTRALFVTHSVRNVPAALTNELPRCRLVDDFWSQHNGRPMSRFQIYLCTPN